MCLVYEMYGSFHPVTGCSDNDLYEYVTGDSLETSILFKAKKIMIIIESDECDIDLHSRG